MEKPMLRKRGVNYHRSRMHFCSTTAGMGNPRPTPKPLDASPDLSHPITQQLSRSNSKLKTTKFHRQFTSTIEFRQLHLSKSPEPEDSTNRKLEDQLLQEISRDSNATVGYLTTVLNQIKAVVGLCHTISCYTRVYPKFQECAFKLVEKARKSSVPFIRFYMFFLVGSCMCHFKNYSLSKVYFNECLKCSLQCRQHSKFQKHLQLKIYGMVTKIFIDTGDYQTARKFAYNYLRKSWQYDSIEDQLNSYDLIGLVEFYNENLSQAMFFHSRMSNGVPEKSDITKLSSLELQNQTTKESFTVGVEAFVENSDRFIQVLKDYFQGLAMHDAEKLGLPDSKRNFGEETFTRRFIMHLSRNREINNFHYSSKYHTFEEISNQYYFLKPKKSTKLSQDIFKFKQTLEAVAKAILTRISDKLNAQSKFQFNE